MKKSGLSHRLWSVGLVLVLATGALVFWKSLGAVSNPEATRFPLRLEYETRADTDETARHEIRMESWWRWTYVQLEGAAAGYTVIAEPSGRVIAGYPDWPSEEWVELQPAGSDELPLPASWIRPYFFQDGDAPGTSLPDRAAAAKQRLGLSEADEVRAYLSTEGTEVIYHVSTGLPLLVSESNGYEVELVAVEEIAPIAGG